MSRTVRPSASVPVSSPVSTASVWPAARRITGCCASILRCLRLPFKDDIRRPARDNAIDVYISDEYEDVLAEGVWQETFKVKPEVLTSEEKKAWLATND